MSASSYRVRTPPENWTVAHTPPAGTLATIAKAADPVNRHFCTGISATLAAGTTAQAAAAILVLRDGASGAGTILWSKQVILPTNGLWEVNISGLNIPGTKNTAMTLEFTAAGAAGTFESVAMTGYDGL